MTTDGSSPHEQALNLAETMYVGPKRGRPGDRSAGEATASIARRRPLVVDPPGADRPPERAPGAPAASATPAEPTAAAASAIATTELEAPDEAPDAAVEEAPDAAVKEAPIARESRPHHLVADAADDGAGLEDDVLWSHDAAAPHDVAALAPRRRRGLTGGEQRRPWMRKRSTPAPAAEVDEAPELEQLYDVAIDVDEAPADAGPIAAVVTDPPPDAEAEAPGVSLRLAGTAQGWQRSRARSRLRGQARPTSVKRRKALRGVIVGLVAGALLAAVIAIGLALGGHADPGARSSTPAPAAPIASRSPSPSAAAAARKADRRERVEHAAAAQARREQQRKAERQRERAARKRREARERRRARGRAARRARHCAATASAPAAVTPAPVVAPVAPRAVAPAPAPAPSAPATPSASSSDRAGWTGEFTP